MTDAPKPETERPDQAVVIPPDEGLTVGPHGLSPLTRGAARSFRNFVATQFLGAFNDNAFRQLILLLAVGGTLGDVPLQSIAAAVFSLPFVIFSGYAGSLADRCSKTTIIVLMKFAEIAIMLAAGIAFYLSSLNALLFTLFFMGAQSAFFGPAKYGYIPESLPDDHLPRANGIVLMTTFLAIILGQGAAGLARDAFGGALWWPAFGLVLLAVLGTVTSMRIRPVPAARPDVSLRRPWGDLPASLAIVAKDRDLLWVVVANSYFWFLGGAMQPIINAYGKTHMGLTDTRTSLLLVSLSVGMASGALLAGKLARGRIDFRHTLIGALVASVGLVTLAWAHVSEALAHLNYLVLGIAGSFFGLPLQSFIQKRAEHDRKGRILAATGFINWIFILMSAGYYGVVATVLPIPFFAAPLAPLAIVAALLVVRRLRIG